MVLTCLGLLVSSGATAQTGMPGGSGDGGQGGHGHQGGPPGGSESGRPSAPRAPKSLKREKFDKAVSAMFRMADTNHDGTVTPDELQSVIDGRRDAVIRSRFARIDSNRNGSIDLDEFLAWQRSMGCAASSEAEAIGGSTYIAANLQPELGDGPDDRILARLIQPLSATVLVNANVHYRTGVTLDELIAYEHERFDANDTNHDGEISINEAREADGPAANHGPGTGDRPGGHRPPPQ